MTKLTGFIAYNYNLFQRFLFSFSLFGISAYCIYMAFISDGVMEPGDGITHYNITRFAPQYPRLYLDHWGKPLYTLLSSPLAQIGFEGLIIFNVLLFCITSIIIYTWAEKQENHFAWLTPWLLCVSAVYFDMMNAGMTEILFATIITATIYLFFREKYVWGALLFSFSIFSRPEGNLVMPIFLVFLLWKKQWKIIPFLSVGFILYSVIGYFHYDDILWVINQNPYPAKVSYYGHGGIFDFLNAYRVIWGDFLAVSTALGTVILIVSLFIKEQKKTVDSVILILVPAIVVFSVHSYIWWKGIHASAGLTRVMATVVPLFVMLALIFFDRIQKIIFANIPSHIDLRPSLLVVGLTITWFFLINESRLAHLPVLESPNQVILSEAAAWYKLQNSPHRICFTDPYFGMKAGLNPFDESKVLNHYSINKENPAKSLESGGYILWDSHLGASDDQIPRELILENPDLEIMKHLRPADTTFAIGNKRYEVILAKIK